MIEKLKYEKIRDSEHFYMAYWSGDTIRYNWVSLYPGDATHECLLSSGMMKKCNPKDATYWVAINGECIAFSGDGCIASIEKAVSFVYEMSGAACMAFNEWIHVTWKPSTMSWSSWSKKWSKRTQRNKVLTTS